MILSKDKNFNQFVIGQTFSQIGEHMSRVSLAWLVFKLSGNENAVFGLSVLAVLQALPPLLFGWLYGILIDSVNSKKNLLFYADLMRGIFFCLIPLCYWFHILDFPLFFILIFCSATFSGLFGPAMFSMLPEFSPEAGSLLYRNSVVNVTGHVGVLLGPLVGGLLAFLFPAGLVVFVTGTTFLISAVMIWKIIGQDLSLETANYHLRELSALFVKAGKLLLETLSKHGFNKHTTENIFYSIRLGGAPKLFCIMAFVVGIASGPINVILPIYVKKTLNGGPFLLGAILSVAGIGMLTASLGLSKLKHSFGVVYSNRSFIPKQEVILMSSMFVSGLFLIPAGLFNNALVGAVFIFFSVGLGDLFSPIMHTEIQAVVPQKQSGRVLTSIGSFFLLGILFGIFVAPSVVGLSGVFGAFIFTGFVRVIAGLLPLLLRTAAEYIN